MPHGPVGARVHEHDPRSPDRHTLARVHDRHEPLVGRILQPSNPELQCARIALADHGAPPVDTANRNVGAVSAGAYFCQLLDHVRAPALHQPLKPVHNMQACTQHASLYTTCKPVHNMQACTQHASLYTTYTTCKMHAARTHATCTHARTKHARMQPTRVACAVPVRRLVEEELKLLPCRRAVVLRVDMQQLCERVVRAPAPQQPTRPTLTPMHLSPGARTA